MIGASAWSSAKLKYTCPIFKFDERDSRTFFRASKLTSVFDRLILPRIWVYLKEEPSKTCYKLHFKKYGKDLPPAFTLFDDSKELHLNLSYDLDASSLFHLVHELQHSISNQYKSDQSEHEMPLIAEGLSLLLEEKILGQAPLQLVERYLGRSETLPLLSWKNSLHGEGRNIDHYAQSYLFMKYLHNNFGGDDLIRTLIKSPEKGMANLLENIKKYSAKNKKTYTNLDDLFLNFSMALLVNQKLPGSLGLMSLSRYKDGNLLAGHRINSIYSLFDEKETSFKLEGLQTIYRRTHNLIGCIDIQKGPNTYVFLVSLEGAARVKPVHHKICPSDLFDSLENYLVISNLSHSSDDNIFRQY